MPPDSLFWIELTEDWRRRRSLVLKFALPVVLIAPLSFADVPSYVKGAALPLLVLFMGVLGASVGLSSLRERGILERLATLPVPPRSLIRSYMTANVVMDILQILGPAMILVVALRPDPGNIALFSFGLFLCVLLANGMGVLMAIAARGAGEVHLYSGICVLLLGGASGLFMGKLDGFMETLSSGFPSGLVSSALSEAVLEGGALHVLAATGVTLLVVAGVMFWSESLIRGGER